MFAAEHQGEHALQAAVTAALDSGPAALQTAFASYRQAALEHLLHEEDVMMPLVARLPPDRMPVEGDPLPLALRADRLHFFDPSNGERLVA